MAPLPSNNTAVLFVDYSTQGHDHTVQCRYDDPATAADAMDSVAELLDAVSDALSLTTIIGARFRPAGSDVTIDIAWTGATAYGEGTGTEFLSALFYDWVGRSTDGRRVRVALFGAETLQMGDNYRSVLGENSVLDAGLAVLQAAEGTFLAIDGSQPIWKSYTNTGVNAYWRNKIR